MIILSKKTKMLLSLLGLASSAVFFPTVHVMAVAAKPADPSMADIIADMSDDEKEEVLCLAAVFNGRLSTGMLTVKCPCCHNPHDFRGICLASSEGLMYCPIKKDRYCPDTGRQLPTTLRVVACKCTV